MAAIETNSFSTPFTCPNPPLCEPDICTVYGACFQKGGEGRIERIINQDTAGVAATHPKDAYVDQEGLPPIRSTDHFGDLASQEYDLYTSPDEEV